MLKYNHTKDANPLPSSSKPYWCIAVATYSRQGNDVSGKYYEKEKADFTNNNTGCK